MIFMLYVPVALGLLKGKAAILLGKPSICAIKSNVQPSIACFTRSRFFGTVTKHTSVSQFIISSHTRIKLLNGTFNFNRITGNSRSAVCYGQFFIYCPGCSSVRDTRSLDFELAQSRNFLSFQQSSLFVDQSSL